ncbi:hypothetical protein [Dyadobacter sp. CY343]|uniref:hypothetical protein n=1 Tax=Dyadobacter sp. CY343 TaxID=2907299 RepID=UPI001F1CFA49|nr:hypothetical protein [Dyadobacter sp. CY343]MCE7063120.1 hypothetical protein [Dyadobacter sp. CY343]
MNYRNTCIVFLLFAFHCSIAQYALEPGYLLVSESDTLKGYIDYKNWPYNPETVSFKASPEAEAKTFGLGDLHGFFVHGENYKRGEVEIDPGSSKIEDLSYSPLPKLEKTVVFLLVINGGAKSLYYLKSRDNRVHLYVSDKPGDYQLLLNHRYLSSGTSQIVTVPHYREQLKNFFSE